MVRGSGLDGLGGRRPFGRGGGVHPHRLPDVAVEILEGALYYMAYATGKAEFAPVEQLWATVAFTIALSVLVHGIAATPVMRRLEDSQA